MNKENNANRFAVRQGAKLVKEFVKGEVLTAAKLNEMPDLINRSRGLIHPPGQIQRPGTC